ncbi:putative Rab32 [Giardia duodenalis]|uniref:Rab32 n=2 Tax=Giardia intestinalis TaxID=5741 RepID=A8B7Z5_GIAIC|nr:putative Rab32 [Giardia intestinalis]ESU35461.1 GTPase [Giardia intestinalis]KAE8305372.1 putative Rab32 [Giardia intestinalis]|eukprot:XP_001708910.1 Rab32, putative [Giardia lamblia ATCC 50803]
MSTNQQATPFMFKILVVGKAYAGKTCCIKRLVHNTFTNSYKSTLGVDFAITHFVIPQEEIQIYLTGAPPDVYYTAPTVSDTSTMQINLSSYRPPCYEGGSKMSLPKTHPIYALPSVSIRAQLWDIAGQERYTSLTRAYYRNAVAAVVVGDLESPTFYEDVLGWKKDIDEKVKLMDTDVPIPCILCCNKIDSEAANAWYAKNGEAVAKFARENRFAGMYTTSALTGANLQCAFQHLCVATLAELLVIQQAQTPSMNPVVVSMEQSKERSANKACC